jgi:hypothetical protein
MRTASELDAFDPRAPLPNFFIVGAPKAGTTSLHAYLSDHPEVFMSRRKEPHYFSSFQIEHAFDNFVRPIRDPIQYQALFQDSKGFKAIGESSTSYLYDWNAPTRIKFSVPDARIIICLRNPVERAYSHYLMECVEGRETRSFSEALEADERRAKKDWGVSLLYVEAGLYSDQVERYLTTFGRSNVLIIIFEEFVRDTANVMHRVARFLDINPEGFKDSAFRTVHHGFTASRGSYARWILRCRPLRLWSKRWVPQNLRWAVRYSFLSRKANKPRMEDSVRLSLAARFAQDLDRLEQLLGRNLDELRDRR